MIATFAALAEPNRLHIVELLRAGGLPVGEIGGRLGLAQPQVSKHLRVLKGAGLVSAEVRAQQRIYRLRPEPLADLHRWLEDYRALWDERFAALDEVLAELSDPTSPRPAVASAATGASSALPASPERTTARTTPTARKRRP